MTKGIKKVASKVRTHADFYEVDPRNIEKFTGKPYIADNGELNRIKETLIIEDFLPYFQIQNGERIASYKLPDQDPPDIEIITILGKTVFVEITELVSQAAIENQILRDSHHKKICEGQEQYLNNQMTGKEERKHLKSFARWKRSSRDYVTALNSWSRRFFLAHLNKQIRDKDNKCADIVDQCDELVLLIHTDEASLSPTVLTDYLAGFNWPCGSLFDRGFIMVSYETGNEDKPIIELPRRRSCTVFNEYILSDQFLNRLNKLPRHSCQNCKR